VSDPLTLPTPPAEIAVALKTAVSQRVIAISNQKGGVGKTTTAVNLATAIAAVHKRVLVIDLDPQGNASTSLGIDHKHRTVGTYNVLLGDAPLSAAIVPTAVPGLSVLPSGVDLAAAEIELIDVENRHARLRDALAAHAQDFDFVLIDCPPSLGLLTLNALVAAHAVMVPLQAEFLALEGISHLAKTIERVRKAFNPTLELQGIVLTMVDGRNKLSELVESDVRGYYGAKVYKTTIPRNVRISEAPSYGKPVLLYDLQSKGSRAYLDLAGEVLKREQGVAA
jgi:chromosome partitioning protein